MDDLFERDLYELMGVHPSCTIQEIKRAYRKKALSCHPDKHPDDPRAVETFRELSKVLEILTDISARTAYDKLQAAKQQTKARIREFDAKRKKFKNDLEAREEAYRSTLNTRYDIKTEKQRLQAEIERLEKEGSKLVEEEVAFVRNKILEEYGESEKSTKRSDSSPAHRRVKIKWKVNGNDPENGGYNEDNLHRILQKYGDISVLVVSSTKKGRAMVEFNNESAAETSVLVETGFAENPLVLQGLWEDTKKKFSSTKDIFCKEDYGNKIFPAYESSDSKKEKPCVPLSFSAAPDIFKTMPDAEFENAVLRNLRKAEERKRLLEGLETAD